MDEKVQHPQGSEVMSAGTSQQGAVLAAREGSAGVFAVLKRAVSPEELQRAGSCFTRKSFTVSPNRLRHHQAHHHTTTSCLLPGGRRRRGLGLRGPRKRPLSHPGGGAQRPRRHRRPEGRHHGKCSVRTSTGQLWNCGFPGSGLSVPCVRNPQPRMGGGFLLGGRSPTESCDHG